MINIKSLSAAQLKKLQVKIKKEIEIKGTNVLDKKWNLIPKRVIKDLLNRYKKLSSGKEIGFEITHKGKVTIKWEEDNYASISDIYDCDFCSYATFYEKLPHVEQAIKQMTAEIKQFNKDLKHLCKEYSLNFEDTFERYFLCKY